MSKHTVLSTPIVADDLTRLGLLIKEIGDYTEAQKLQHARSKSEKRRLVRHIRMLLRVSTISGRRYIKQENLPKQDPCLSGLPRFI